MPTKSKLVYLPPAQHDFEEIVKYHITEAGTPYARKIYSTMKTTINRLRDFPLMGQTHPDPILAASGYRKLVLTKTYVAIYKLIGDTVYVYAIVNGTTDYPEKGYPDAVKAFSYAGFIANELVLDASGNTAGNLTEAQTKSVWDWYSY